MVRRWQLLPLDHALRASAPVHALAQELADRVADAAGRSRTDLPDLGPATALDQLVVTVYDAQQAGQSAHLDERLTGLLRDIA
ncbi:hypothetical protein [Leekyejoonella antrihumi]|uniref:Uncharacterized protein n=1 Tax=Leekyejoonella antrihumi TaxID=1660198 RepID=A0A563DUU4_9MICO|nr:hypothetical protein [Leekyejoonella antrihumi]TWP33464.1 hypothetical protein FGL98_21120 [Leekyejoonella antrihumi]